MYLYVFNSFRDNEGILGKPTSHCLVLLPDTVEKCFVITNGAKIDMSELDLTEACLDAKQKVFVCSRR